MRFWVIALTACIGGWCTTAAALGPEPGVAGSVPGELPLRQALATRPSAAAERFAKQRAALRAARERGDWEHYFLEAQGLKRTLGGSPQSRLDLARAYVRVGQNSAALQELAAYVRMGQSSQLIEQSSDFAPLRGMPEYAGIKAALGANRQPVAHAVLAWRIADPGLLPEDIDFAPATARFYLSSVLQHRIVSTTRDGSVTEFARAPDDWPVLALKVDARRSLLWATEVAMEGFHVVAKPEQGRSALLCYDLVTGRLVRRIEGPYPSALGDLSLTRDGDVLVSDGAHGGVYRIKSGQQRLERLDHGEFISPQTIALSPDSARLYVPDYAHGIGVLDLSTGQVSWLATQDRFALSGIDGLYGVGTELLAVQNGTEPERVVRFVMAKSGKVAREEVIERASPTLGDPTHGVMVGGDFYYIANSGWDVLGEDGLVKPGANLTEAVVMKWEAVTQ
jgi:hypothetical protein